MEAEENSSIVEPSHPVIPPEDLGVRIGLLFALLVISAAFSLLPVLCSLKRKRKGTGAKESKDKPWKAVLLSVLNCFAGGVFLGVTFLHLLPDITRDWEVIFSQMWRSTYPFDKFLVVLGFFLVLIIEQVAYACQRTRPKKAARRVAPAPPPQIRIQPNIVASLTASMALAEASALERNGVGNAAADCKQCRQEHARHTREEVPSDSENEHDNQGQSLLGRNTVRYSSPDSAKVQGHIAKIEGEDEGEGEEAVKDGNTSPGGLRAVFLGLALSVHSVFEGLAFGLIQNASDAIQVFVGIAIHKSVIGLSLGIALVSTCTRLLLALTLVAIFVVSSPIGIAIGLSLRTQLTDSVDSLITSAVLEALACGTFTYITFLELIGHEFANVNTVAQKQRLLLVLACIVGFGLLAGLTFLDS